MNRRWILIIGIVLIIVGTVGIFLKSKFKPSQAGLQIETTPQATVYINDEEVGKTPFNKTMEPGEITLRLVPIATDKPLAPWTTKLKLAQGVFTVVKREFGETDYKSSGEMLSFEKISGNSASLSVVSTPNVADIVVDGEGIGLTPIRKDSLTVGHHQISVSRPGYGPRSIPVTTEAGYKLTVVAMLAQEDSQVQGEATESADEASSSAKAKESTSSASLKTTQVKGGMVEILDTPTGFLRVRKEPAVGAEVAQVKPGDKLPYIDENADRSWFKIEYEAGKQGWVSAAYAKRVT